MEITNENVWSWYTCINILILFGIGEGVGYIKCSRFDWEGYFYCVKAVLLISCFQCTLIILKMIIIYFLDPHRMLLLPCLQRLIFHLIVFRFSHQILQWARRFLVLTYLPKLYCIDTHLTYIYIVNHLIISYVCDIMLSLCVVRVSQLFWNCILIYFFTLTLSVMKVWLHVLWFLASMRKMILCQGAGHSIQQYRINPFNPSCSYIHHV